MGKFRVEIEAIAQEDFIKIYKSVDRATIKRLEKMLVELENHPKIGIGHPEQLKHQLSGFWSRRINSKDRLIYEIFEEPDNLVVVVSALGHY